MDLVCFAFLGTVLEICVSLKIVLGVICSIIFFPVFKPNVLAQHVPLQCGLALTTHHPHDQSGDQQLALEQNLVPVPVQKHQHMIHMMLFWLGHVGNTWSRQVYSTTKKKVYMCMYYVIQWILGNRGNNWSPRPHKHTKVPRSRYRLLLSFKHGETFQSSPIFMAKDINLPIQILANLWFLDG